MRYVGVVAMALLVGVASCKQSEPVGFLDNIPARSSAIAAIDLDQMLKMAGCGSKAGKLSLTDDLSNLLARMDSNVLECTRAIASQGHWLDLSQTYSVYDSNTRQWIMTAPIKEDMQAPPGYAALTKSELLGHIFTYPITQQVTMVVAGDQAYFVSPDDAVHSVEQMVSQARVSSIGNNPQLQEFFGDTPVAKLRFLLDLTENPVGEPCDEVRVALTLRERTLSLYANAYNKGAAVNPLSSLLPIDPEALDWMPNGCVAAAAIGVSPAVLKKALKMYQGVDATTRLAINGLIAMLDHEGGTLALGAAPGGSAETIKKFTMDNWQLKAMLPMGERVEPAAQLIDKFVEGIYSETVDDYLALTNYDPESYPSEYDAWPATAFGAKALFTVAVPYKSQTMKALRFKNGYELKVVAADSMAITTLRLLGTGDYITPAIVRDALQVMK